MSLRFIFRLIGLIITLVGFFWGWKSNFELLPIWGLPLPIQPLTVLLGAVTLIWPAQSLSVVALLIPSTRISKNLNKFVAKELNSNTPVQVTIHPTDQGVALSDKLNKAITQSRRRFWIAVVVVLTTMPLIFYFNQIRSKQIAKIDRYGDILARAVQKKRFNFKSIGEYRELLDDTKEITTLTPENSAINRIYRILDQVYDPNIVKNDDMFHGELNKIYKREFTDVLSGGPFNFKKIYSAPSTSELPAAKQSLLIILAIICENEGDNGRLFLPHLYERGILNELSESSEQKPNIVINLDGTNYSCLLKSIQIQGDPFRDYPEIVKSVFPDKIPDINYLATQAKSNYDKYSKDKTNIAQMRYLNNIVDLYITCIYLVRIKGKQFNISNIDQGAAGFAQEMSNPDLTAKFAELDRMLDQANDNYNDGVVQTTKAQLYSLEGEWNEKENTPNSRDKDWCRKKRQQALSAINSALAMKQPRETFLLDRADNAYLGWLSKDVTIRDAIVAINPVKK